MLKDVPHLIIPSDTSEDSQQVGLGSPGSASRLQDALQHLRQVDMILEQLSAFWANTELVLDVLTKKGQHVEQLIGFGQKPKLFARFQERMGEYRQFWEGVQDLCKNYIHGAHSSNGEASADTTPGTKGNHSNAYPRGNVNRNNSGGNEFDFMESDSHDSVFREFISRNSAASPAPEHA